MKQRPWPLLMYSIILLLVAASLPIQVAIDYELPISQIFRSFKYLTHLNVIMMALLLAASAAAQMASKSLLALAPIAAISVALNNLWVGYVELNFTGLEAWLATALFMGFSAILLERRTAAVIIDKKMQWWKTPARLPIEKQIVLMPWIGERVAATTLDLSESGVFVRCSEASNLNVGDRMQMRMKLEGHLDVRCTARLVRKATSKAGQPVGFGIRFEDLSRHDRRALRTLVNAEKTI